MGLTVTVLGCSGSYAGPGSACSGYLVESDDVKLVIDMGSGTMANLRRHVDIRELDAVVLSHSHADHWTDLALLRTALKYTFEQEGLPVYGTAATRRLADMLATDLGPTLDWHDTADGDEIEVGHLRLRLSQTDHYVETHAVRIDDPRSGRTLAYSADTGPAWSLGALGDDIDLVLCESTYPTDDEVGEVLHLSAEAAGRMARQTGVGALVLTHLLPETDPEHHRVLAAETFGAPVHVAHAGARYEV